MTVGQLARVYEEIVGEPTRSRHKQYLIRRILWRGQAWAEGDLSERARRRAAELADDAEVRVTAPRRPTTSASVVLPAAKLDAVDTLADARLPAAGNVVVRKYQGQRFRSLSAIAKLVTGSYVSARLETGGLRLEEENEGKT